ncbi:MAG: Nudix hydrolase protein [Patescibacteria group bacterium]|jgi:8-oxo-dGTP pyrophosphatase MutT (NUDIX family)|nr:Nudix hydrolase protein [Patescibacteria group bacterium]
MKNWKFSKFCYYSKKGRITNMEQELNEIGDELKCPVAILVKDNKILTGHRHYASDNGEKNSVWTVPGGRSNKGEIMIDALRREVFEEVGITEFKIVDFIGEIAGAKEGDTVKIFFCTTNQDFKLMEPEKFSEWRWVSKSEYIEGGEYLGFNMNARKLIVDYLKKLS